MPLLVNRLFKIYREASRWSLAEQPVVDSYLMKQLEKFVESANYIQEELGAWAAEFYIAKSVQILRQNNAPRLNILGNQSSMNSDLVKLLEPLLQTDSSLSINSTQGMKVSPKVDRLIDFLELQEHRDLQGIIFVERRVAVGVLQELLSTHPRTKGILRCGLFVGNSASSSRKSVLGEWLTPAAQESTLDEFRQKVKNLIIATSVLEEGIDISACNLIVCFNDPTNLKSYIQRRGRARKEKSQFALMVSDGIASRINLERWEQLEKLSIEEFSKEPEAVKEILDPEDAHIDTDLRFEIKETE